MGPIEIITASVAVFGLLLTLMKLMVSSVKSELSGRDIEQEKLIVKLQADIDATSKKLADTRTELHSQYARRADLQTLEEGVRSDINKLFDGVNGISRDVNQMIGEFRAWVQMRAGKPDGPQG
jgi:benzoyl-CoA reductase/2-hydroxyglutaryl-CoA dehydratase subunit BcrC/BadD/HgdB